MSQKLSSPSKSMLTSVLKVEDFVRILGVISPNIWLIGMEDKKIRKPSDPMEFEDLPWGINIVRQYGKGASINGFRLNNQTLLPHFSGVVRRDIPPPLVDIPFFDSL